MGIRQKLAEEFGSSPDKEGKLGKQHTDNVIVTPLRSDSYFEDIASSIFCGVMPGDGWSGRMEDSILQGCIPVIIQVFFFPSNNLLLNRIKIHFEMKISKQHIWYSILVYFWKFSSLHVSRKMIVE